MAHSIILLGAVPGPDRELLQNAAASFDFEILILPAGLPPTFDSESNPPAGCISFLPCTQEAMLDMFGALPVGFGREIPLFQRIDGEDCPAFCATMPFAGFFRPPLTAFECRNIMLSMTRDKTLTRQNREIIGEVMKYRRQKHQLIKIGTSLSLQNDLDKLLSLILAESRDIVAADAGSIYIREKNGPGGSFTDRIRFKISQNDSVDIAAESSEFSIPINKNSVAGYVAYTGETLAMEDIAKLDDSAPYKKARKEYEDKFDYPVKSMLTVPLKNLNGDVAGVLQLMNKKINTECRLRSPDDTEKFVAPFTLSDEDFVLSIASQAAVSIERVQLYQEIKDIFEGYLRSSIAAIDERDRVTYGHSRRVMGYAMAFADAVNRETGGPFDGMHFSEDRKNQFRFAALLHDIGKIGVPEALLTKAFRLSNDGMAVIQARGEYIKVLLPARAAKEPLPWQCAADVDADVEFLATLNKAGFINDSDFARLQKISGKFYFDAKGNKLPFLSDRECECLSVRKGNLTEKERDRVNSHAQATRRILSRIPWTSGLEQIPEIASHHHERLDGSGYPDGLKEEQLSFESKALAVIDIYEALVAQDRPYKPKMPPQKAFEILRAEAKANHLDGRIVEFFISTGTYKIFLDEQTPDATPA
jgi:HD-GYP domain-containing protein (c-di-GMP phosphodiesterase class II)